MTSASTTRSGISVRGRAWAVQQPDITVQRNLESRGVQSPVAQILSRTRNQFGESRCIPDPENSRYTPRPIPIQGYGQGGKSYCQ